MKNYRLFKPAVVGAITVNNRIVMSPMTRSRAIDNIPNELMATYYAQRANRPDLVCVSLSDPEVLKQLTEGDFIIDARGRRYFSNELVLTRLPKIFAWGVPDAASPLMFVPVGAGHV